MRCPPILLRKNSNKRTYRQHLYIFLTMRKTCLPWKHSEQLLLKNFHSFRVDWRKMKWTTCGEFKSGVEWIIDQCPRFV